VSIDTAVVARVAQHVGEQLAAERITRASVGRLPLAIDDERELARSVVLRDLDDLAGEHLAIGRSPLDEAQEQRLVAAVLAKVLGLGRIQPLLDDPKVTDIHIRGCASTRLKLSDGRRLAAAPVVDTDDELVELVRIVATRLGRSERRFDAGNPEVNLQLPDGSRLFATMEVSARPSVVIRKHRFELSTLDELEERGLIDRTLLQFFASAVRAKRNIIIAGGTGTGKTTMLRALLNEAPPSDRIITIEDAYELAIDRFDEQHPDHDMLQSRPANIEGRGAITMMDLTRMALRMDPDRVIVGEVRGAEAFPMLMAMSQGNNGSMCTMHADSTKTVFPKLAAYVSMAETNLPIETVNMLISTAVHFVVHIDVIDCVRRVVSVREVVDADGVNIVSNEVFASGGDGCAVPAYPMRDSTLDMLEKFGFDQSGFTRNSGRGVR
jgi:pilus assembly protein CpaF